MDMDIVDHVADLRLQFSGFWAWVHIASIVAFFFPYVWFLIAQWKIAAFSVGGSSITLFEALLRYICNGGKDWRTDFAPDYFAISRFALVLFYQITRFTLLAKTKRLEMEQIVKGVPARFTLEMPIVKWKIWKTDIRVSPKWKLLVDFLKWAVVVVAALALWNLIHFLQMRVPTEIVIPLHLIPDQLPGLLRENSSVVPSEI